nr:conjugal transfer protein TraX [Lachnospiraceae bacterium]
DFKKQALALTILTVMYATAYFLIEDKVYGMVQLCALFSLPILKMYNGERGNWKGMKWFFYIYYPAHMFVIGFIRVLLGKGSIFP